MSNNIINQSEARRKNILENKRALFELRDNPSANIYKGEILENLPFAHKMGVNAVSNHLNLIIKESEKQKVDANLVAAIFYMENSHGYYGGLGPIADKIGYSKSVLPANIRSMWNGLVGKNGNIENIHDNIVAGIILIKRISQRIENPTVERIATLYNSLAQEQVTSYGARVGEIFRTHKWGQELYTNYPAKSNIINENSKGYEIIIPNDFESKKYQIKEFSELEKSFLEKALEHPHLVNLNENQINSFLYSATLLDEKQELQASLEQAYQTPNQFGFSQASLEQADKMMQERLAQSHNQNQSQGRGRSLG